MQRGICGKCGSGDMVITHLLSALRTQSRIACSTDSIIVSPFSAAFDFNSRWSASGIRTFNLLVAFGCVFISDTSVSYFHELSIGNHKKVFTQTSYLLSGESVLWAYDRHSLNNQIIPTRHLTRTHKSAMLGVYSCSTVLPLGFWRRL